MLTDQIGAFINRTEVGFLCRGCGALNMPANGSADHVLLCPRRHRVLGIWPTSSDRDRELKALIDESCCQESRQT